MRVWLIWLGALFVFGQFYAMVAHKEALRRQGDVIFLKLAPVDPRSFFQGDYMALRYDLIRQLEERLLPVEYGMPKMPSSGAFVIRLHEQQVANFVRFDDGTPLAAGEHRLRFRHDDHSFVLGAERFYIPEGTGAVFAKAAYGEIRVSSTGEAFLVGLRNKDFQPITPP